jgi:hypothetical protein
MLFYEVIWSPSANFLNRTTLSFSALTLRVELDGKFAEGNTKTARKSS